MRQPPRLGPRTVECTATAQYRPERGPRRTSSCSCSRVTGGRSTAGRDDSAPAARGGSGAGGGFAERRVGPSRRGGLLGGEGGDDVESLVDPRGYRPSAATIFGNTSRGASRPKNTSMWE